MLNVGQFSMQIMRLSGSVFGANQHRALNGFVRGTKALLGHVHAQHARQPDRRVTNALDLRLERLDLFMQLAPRRHTVDLGQEAVAPRQLFLGGVFKVGEGLLHDGSHRVNVALLSQVGLPQGNGPR